MNDVIVRGDTEAGITNAIVDNIKLGLQPYGPLAVISFDDQIWFYQAMVRYGEEGE